MKTLDKKVIKVTNDEQIIANSENQIENELIIDRAIKGKIEKARKGFYVGGKVHLFGYNIIKKEGGKILEINNEQKEIVKRIFEMFFIGMYTPEEIKIILEKENIDLGTHDGKIHTSTISRILREDTYTGVYYIGKTWLINEPENNELFDLPIEPKYWYGLSCPKIISDDLYQGVQERFLEDNIKNWEN